MKNKKGITLIALVVTIIVLLILAGITLSLVSGENGVLKRAEQSAIVTEEEKFKENFQLDVKAKEIEYYEKKYVEGESTPSFQEYLEKELEGKDYLETDSGGKIYKEEEGKLKYSDKNGNTGTIVIDEEGKITLDEIEIKGTTVGEAPEKPDIADKSEVSKPNLNKIAQKAYVIYEWNESTSQYDEILSETQPNNWYDYENGKWANIKTTNKVSDTETLEAYWVWIPRYEYVVPTSTTATEIEVKLIPTSQQSPDEGYTIHPAFTNEGNGGFGDLDGIWVGKYEAVSDYPSAEYGGGDRLTLKVQVIPNQPSWRFIATNNIFTVCRRLTNEGEVLAGSTVDSHMMKNTEWGAVAILSQSKYGVYNPESLNGEKGDKEYQIWNNSGKSYITGSVGTSKDASSTLVSGYNSTNGPKASTTGTVYGVYDMAGGAYEYVAGCCTARVGYYFGVTTYDSKYVDYYVGTGSTSSPYDGAKIGDATKETKGWNGDYSSFVYSSAPVFSRGR